MCDYDLVGADVRRLKFSQRKMKSELRHRAQLDTRARQEGCHKRSAGLQPALYSHKPKRWANTKSRLQAGAPMARVSSCALRHLGSCDFFAGDSAGL